MKLLLVGASGLVGSHVLGKALADDRVELVTAPVRRPLAAHPKLLAPEVDFDALPQGASWWRADAVICALGTTLRTAGSRAAFRKVDYDYPLAVARLARSHGTPTFVLNSAMSAKRSSWVFYSRVKGELEGDLETLRFPSLTLVRPGLIGGQRQENRPGERLAVAAFTLLAPVLPRSLQINPAAVIAQAMIEAAIAGSAGRHLIGSAELVAR